MSENGDGRPEGTSSEEERLRRRPVRHPREAVHEEAAREIEAQRGRPWEEPEHTRPSVVAQELEEPQSEHLDPAAMRRAERLVNGMFVLSILGTIGFCVAYATMSITPSDWGLGLNLSLGASLGVSMGAAGMAFVLWAKKLMPHEDAVQEREPHHSPEEDQLLTEELFLRGADELGLPRRKFMRRAALVSLGVLPIPFVFALRDMGPLPKDKLQHSGWRKGVRLVDVETEQPIKLGDLPIGGFVTVMPEGFKSVNEFPVAPTLLIRLPPGVNQPMKGREGWAVDDHVAYNKICTHAGCPVGLYEQQTHHLLCPCHQSTFDVPRGCKVIYGPAGHPLPQLPITVDADGYFRAQSDYTVPAGPAFWER